jgi:hypothetical protein
VTAAPQELPIFAGEEGPPFIRAPRAAGGVQSHLARRQVKEAYDKARTPYPFGASHLKSRGLRRRSCFARSPMGYRVRDFSCSRGYISRRAAQGLPGGREMWLKARLPSLFSALGVWQRSIRGWTGCIA